MKTTKPKLESWYLADLVEEMRLAKRKKQHVYINTVLILATSPDDAYAKARQIGRASEHSYLNVDGETVTCRFRGLRALNAIQERLEHGCELASDSRPGLTEGEIRELVVPQEKLAAFAKTPTMDRCLWPGDVVKKAKPRKARKAKKKSAGTRKTVLLEVKATES